MTPTKARTGMPAEEALDAVLDGWDCRIEREDADIFDFETGEHRYFIGGRLHVRPNGSDRWKRTDLWLVQNPDNPDHELTFAGVLRSFAAVADTHAAKRAELLPPTLDGGTR